MAEIYIITRDGNRISFSPAKESLPASVLSSKFIPPAENTGLRIICRMGDPDLVQCAVFRQNGEDGGIFALHGKDGLMFAAIARDNLAYVLALGFFGELTANARYGVDVFENMELPDD